MAGMDPTICGYCGYYKLGPHDECSVKQMMMPKRDMKVLAIEPYEGLTEETIVKPDGADPINPDHYKAGGIETIDFIEAKDLDFYLANAVKYISRAGKKDPAKVLEDLKKAVWYLNRKIARLEAK